jgi:hypothetical protein
VKSGGNQSFVCEQDDKPDGDKEYQPPRGNPNRGLAEFSHEAFFASSAKGTAVANLAAAPAGECSEDVRLLGKSLPVFHECGMGASDSPG